MGSEEALRHIKEIAPALPVILSSGYDASQAVNKFAGNLLAGFLHKPSTVTDMLLTLKKAVDGKRYHRSTLLLLHQERSTLLGIGRGVRSLRAASKACEYPLTY